MKNNPPAFPVAENHKIAADLEWTAGMTLRDYFAGQALVGLVSNANVHEPQGTFGKQAYIYADAMLAERDKEI